MRLPGSSAGGAPGAARAPSPSYDRIGTTYAATRATDPRLAARIWAALGDARTVVNVGAGTGNYEPAHLEVTAVEPSEVMIAQRPAGAAPVVRATAEALPFPDGGFDASMAVLSVQHWSDRAAGLREMRRVARRRAVVFGFDPACLAASWIVREYIPSAATLEATRTSIAEAVEALGGARVERVPIPHDCIDGFLHAYWRRPQAYLDPRVRAGISVFALIDQAEVDAGMARLARDLDSGAWHARHGHLLALDELDLGYRLLVAGD